MLPVFSELFFLSRQLKAASDHQQTIAISKQNFLEKHSGSGLE
jgi:hypothetical protein